MKKLMCALIVACVGILCVGCSSGYIVTLDNDCGMKTLKSSTASYWDVDVSIGGQDFGVVYHNSRVSKKLKQFYITKFKIVKLVLNGEEIDPTEYNQYFEKNLSESMYDLDCDCTWYMGLVNFKSLIQTENSANPAAVNVSSFKVMNDYKLH